MIYQLADIKRDVRVCMDHNNVSESLLAELDPETLTLDGAIEASVERGARIVELAAPVYRLETGHHFGDAVYWGEGGTGYVLLPDDFMRLVAFRMSDWERTCHGAILPEDPEYARQSSRYKGVRGNPQKPVCAVVMHPEGLALEFYSCRGNDAQVVAAQYVPFPVIDPNGGIEISERCYEAVVYQTAALVLTGYGEGQKGALMGEIAKTMLQ